MSKLKQLFPNHKLGDKHDYELQQFTANDMLEFAESVAKEALKNASDNASMDTIPFTYGETEINKQSILNENNIPKI